MRRRCIEVAVHVKGHLGWLSDPAGRNRVKPMQASKVTMRMPTLLPFGEGSNERGKQSTRAPARSAGVVGTARRKGGSGNRGRLVLGEGSVLKRCGRQRPWRESDR